jgi:hypothetical protein
MTVNPKTLAEDTPFMTGMRRMTSRVGVLACLNRRPEKRGAFLFSAGAGDERGYLGVGSLDFASFVGLLEPSICEELTDSQAGYWYKKPVVPKGESNESGYVLDAQSPFLELGKGKGDDNLTNGERVLATVSNSLKTFTGFLRRGNDLIDLFGAVLDKLNQTTYTAAPSGPGKRGKDLKQPFSSFARGKKLPDGLVVPLVNFLFARGSQAVLDADALWAGYKAEDDPENVWKRFAAEKECRAVFADVIKAFKACLLGQTDAAHATVKTKLAEVVRENAANDLAKVPADFKAAFEAYHYLGQVLRSKVLLMSVAQSVVSSYFSEAKPLDDEYVTEFGKIQEGKGGADGYGPPRKRLPERLRRQFRELLLRYLDYALRSVKDQAEKATVTAPGVYAAIEGRLSAEFKSLEEAEEGRFLDRVSEVLLLDGEKLAKEDSARLAKIKLTKDEKAQLKKLREQSLPLPEEDVAAVLMLRCLAHMAGPLEQHLNSFKEMFAGDKNAFQGFVTANQNLVIDVVCPILFATPGLSPEQMIDLFKESLNTVFVNAVLLEDATLAEVIKVANEFYGTVSRGRMEDYQPAGVSYKVTRMQPGATVQTVTELIPRLLSAVMVKGGEKLKKGLEVLRLLLPDYVRRIRNAAAAKKAGPGDIWTLRKPAEPATQAAGAVAPTSTAVKTRGPMAQELVHVVEQLPGGAKQKSALQAEEKRLLDLRAKGRDAAKDEKLGAADVGGLYQKVEAARKGKNDTPQEIYQSVKLGLYEPVVDEAYDEAKKAKDKLLAPGVEYEQLVAGLTGLAFRKVETLYKEGVTAREAARDEALAKYDEVMAKEGAADAEVESATDARGAAESALATFSQHMRPDVDVVRKAVVAHAEVAKRQPAPPPAPQGWGGMLPKQHEKDIGAIQRKPEGQQPKAWEKLLGGKLRPEAVASAEAFDNLWQDVYDGYAKHGKSKPEFGREVERLSLLHLMLLAEPELDLGLQMSEYYAMLLDLVKAPDLAEFRRRYSLTNYFDLQSPTDLTRLHNTLTTATREALDGIKSFVSELLGLEQLFKAAAANPRAEVVVWNMTADDFLRELSVTGQSVSRLAGPLLAAKLGDPDFQLPLALYATDSAFEYQDETKGDEVLKKADFLERLAATRWKHHQSVLVPPAVVMSFQGIKAEVQPAAKAGAPPKVVVSYYVPAKLTQLPANGAAFPFVLVGPSRYQSLSEAFLTCIPAGYDLLAYLLGHRSEAVVPDVNLEPVRAKYLKLLSLTGTSLTAGFDDLMFPKRRPDSLWVDLFLHGLNVTAVYRCKEPLGEEPFELPADVLTDWFDLWINGGTAGRGLDRPAVAGRGALADLACRCGPQKLTGDFWAALDVVPKGEVGADPVPPLNGLDKVVVLGGREYKAEWFNRLWEGLRPH